MDLPSRDGEQKSFKLFGHFSIVFLSISLFAGSFEDFKSSQVTSFSHYIDARDMEFKHYLDNGFQEYKSQLSSSLYTMQKPRQPEVTKATSIKNAGPHIKIKIQDFSKKNYIKTLLVTQANKDITFKFFGTEVGLNYDLKMQNAKFYPQNQKGIGNFFEAIASSSYSYLVDDLNKIAKKLSLNDWGIYLLVEHFSRSVFSNKDDADLLTWFLLNKLGYDVKVGIASRHIILMHYSKKIIYATPFFTFHEKKFYVLSGASHIESVYSYEQSYPNATKALDLQLSTLPHFALDIRKKTIEFRELGKKYKINFLYNQNLINFMATYPQADYRIYFNTPLDEITYNSLANSLKIYIDKEQASKAINFILHFVQNGFQYQRDQQQFSKEKVMFANETLYFSKSDCEDRAILFAILVKKMFHIRVVGVKYKNHMATALYIPFRGDSIDVHGKKFVLSDPTYINANIGQSMPHYKFQQPESFIILK